MTSTGIVLVVLIACIAGVAMHYISEKNKADEGDDGEGLQDVLSQLDAIEERVKVLERIITENKFDLKREIENL